MASATKTNWADDVDEAEALPARTETTGPDGIITIVEWKFNDDGKKVKVTRRIKRVLSKQAVSHSVATRKTWSKFGAERGNSPGPQTATTTVAENMQFKLGVGKAEEVKEAGAEGEASALKVKKIVCRLCKGDHFTSKCPYKETLAGLGDDSTATPDFGEEPSVGGGAPAPGGGLGGPSKYVPPSMRGGPGASTRGPSEGSRYPGGPSAGGAREELPTLRVTNVAEDVEEDDLRELFEKAVGHLRNNRVARVYVGKDRETGAKKGYAFVSFESREVAEYARQKVDGQGYSNLILNVAFSQPREPRPAA